MPADQSSHSQGSWSAWSECTRHWRAYVLAWAVAIAAAFVICAGIPNTYSAQVKIADEHKESDLLLGLNAFASWAKGAINERQGVRLPDVYYRLVTSPSFIDEMKQVRVEGYGTDYYHYILRHHKSSWWEQFAKAFSSDTLTEEERAQSRRQHPNIPLELFISRGEITIGEKVIVLYPGDCIYFDASNPHCMRAINNARVEFLTVII